MALYRYFATKDVFVDALLEYQLRRASGGRADEQRAGFPGRVDAARTARCYRCWSTAAGGRT